MDRSGDMFSQFMDRLARHMDDHRTRAGDLAAEMFVSRSLLDRLVSAAAGEPPARFRRRLLLERAACRLRAGNPSVIDVAVEAGYSSGEAFTRAFRRAYGAAPSAWRSTAGPVHLGPPGGLHFYPPGGLRVPGQKEATSMKFAAEVIDHHVAVLDQLLDRAGSLAAGQLDAPIDIQGPGIDASPTIRSLLFRLVTQMEMWGAAMASRPYDFTLARDETIDSLRERLRRTGPEFAGYVRAVCEGDRFGETFVDATGKSPYVFTAAGMIAHVMTYAAYRRTVLVSALAAAGAGDVDDDPLSWFVP